MQQIGHIVNDEHGQAQGHGQAELDHVGLPGQAPAP